MMNFTSQLIKDLWDGAAVNYKTCIEKCDNEIVGYMGKIADALPVIEDLLKAIQYAAKHNAEGLAQHKGQCFINIISVIFQQTIWRLSRDGPLKSVQTVAELCAETANVLADTNSNAKKDVVKETAPYFLDLFQHKLIGFQTRLEILKSTNLLFEQCPVQIKEDLLNDSDNANRIHGLTDLVKTIGDYEFQVALVECLMRLFPKKLRQHYAEKFIEGADICASFMEIKDQNFEVDCRLFLNTVNSAAVDPKKGVFSLPCAMAFAGSKRLMKPSDPGYEEFWVDFNIGSERITFFCEQHSSLGSQMSAMDVDMWETMVINKTDVHKLSYDNVTDVIVMEVYLKCGLCDIYSQHQDVEENFIKIHFLVELEDHVQHAVNYTFNFKEKKNKASTVETPINISVTKVQEADSQAQLAMPAGHHSAAGEEIGSVGGASQDSTVRKQKVSIPSVPMSIVMMKTEASILKEKQAKEKKRQKELERNKYLEVMEQKQTQDKEVNSQLDNNLRQDKCNKELEVEKQKGMESEKQNEDEKLLELQTKNKQAKFHGKQESDHDKKKESTKIKQKEVEKQKQNKSKKKEDKPTFQNLIETTLDEIEYKVPITPVPKSTRLKAKVKTPVVTVTPTAKKVKKSESIKRASRRNSQDKETALVSVDNTKESALMKKRTKRPKMSSADSGIGKQVTTKAEPQSTKQEQAQKRLVLKDITNTKPQVSTDAISEVSKQSLKVAVDTIPSTDAMKMKQIKEDGLKQVIKDTQLNEVDGKIMESGPDDDMCSIPDSFDEQNTRSKDVHSIPDSLPEQHSSRNNMVADGLNTQDTIQSRYNTVDTIPASFDEESTSEPKDTEVDRIPESLEKRSTSRSKRKKSNAADQESLPSSVDSKTSGTKKKLTKAKKGKSSSKESKTTKRETEIPSNNKDKKSEPDCSPSEVSKDKRAKNAMSGLDPSLIELCQTGGKESSSKDVHSSVIKKQTSCKQDKDLDDQKENTKQVDQEMVTDWLNDKAKLQEHNKKGNTQKTKTQNKKKAANVNSDSVSSHSPMYTATLIDNQNEGKTITKGGRSLRASKNKRYNEDIDSELSDSDETGVDVDHSDCKIDSDNNIESIHSTFECDTVNVHDIDTLDVTTKNLTIDIEPLDKDLHLTSNLKKGKSNKRDRRSRVSFNLPSTQSSECSAIESSIDQVKAKIAPKRSSKNKSTSRVNASINDDSAFIEDETDHADSYVEIEPKKITRKRSKNEKYKDTVSMNGDSVTVGKNGGKVMNENMEGPTGDNKGKGGVGANKSERSGTLVNLEKSIAVADHSSPSNLQVVAAYPPIASQDSYDDASDSDSLYIESDDSYNARRYRLEADGFGKSQRKRSKLKKNRISTIESTENFSQIDIQVNVAARKKQSLRADDVGCLLPDNDDVSENVLMIDQINTSQVHETSKQRVNRRSSKKANGSKQHGANEELKRQESTGTVQAHDINEVFQMSYFKYKKTSNKCTQLLSKSGPKYDPYDFDAQCETASMVSERLIKRNDPDNVYEKIKKKKRSSQIKVSDEKIKIIGAENHFDVTDEMFDVKCEALNDTDNVNEKPKKKKPIKSKVRDEGIEIDTVNEKPKKKKPIKSKVKDEDIEIISAENHFDVADEMFDVQCVEANDTDNMYEKPKNKKKKSTKAKEKVNAVGENDESDCEILYIENEFENIIEDMYAVKPEAHVLRKETNRLAQDAETNKWYRKKKERKSRTPKEEQKLTIPKAETPHISDCIIPKMDSGRRQGYTPLQINVMKTPQSLQFNLSQEENKLGLSVYEDQESNRDCSISFLDSSLQKSNKIDRSWIAERSKKKLCKKYKPSRQRRNISHLYDDSPTDDDGALDQPSSQDASQEVCIPSLSLGTPAFMNSFMATNDESLAVTPATPYSRKENKTDWGNISAILKQQDSVASLKMPGDSDLDLDLYAEEAESVKDVLEENMKRLLGDSGFISGPSSEVRPSRSTLKRKYPDVEVSDDIQSSLSSQVESYSEEDDKSVLVPRRLFNFNSTERKARAPTSFYSTPTKTPDFDFMSVCSKQTKTTDLDVMCQSSLSSFVTTFGADLQKQLKAKKQRLESYTRHTLKDMQTHFKDAWLGQQDYCSNVVDDFQGKVAVELTALEKDIHKMAEVEKKTEEFFQYQVGALRTNQESQKIRLGNLNKYQSHLAEKMRTCNKHSHDSYKQLHKTMRKDMAQLQGKLLKETQKQEFQNVKRSLQNLF